MSRKLTDDFGIPLTILATTGTGFVTAFYGIQNTEWIFILIGVGLAFIPAVGVIESKRSRRLEKRINSKIEDTQKLNNETCETEVVLEVQPEN